MTGGQVSLPMVIRGASGGGLGFGAQHSQALENWAMCVIWTDPNGHRRRGSRSITDHRSPRSGRSGRWLRRAGGRWSMFTRTASSASASATYIASQPRTVSRTSQARDSKSR